MEVFGLSWRFHGLVVFKTRTRITGALRRGVRVKMRKKRGSGNDTLYDYVVRIASVEI